MGSARSSKSVVVTVEQFLVSWVEQNRETCEWAPPEHNFEEQQGQIHLNFKSSEAFFRSMSWNSLSGCSYKTRLVSFFYIINSSKRTRETEVSLVLCLPLVQVTQRFS